MPYRCVHCSRLYSDGSQEILVGCSVCQSKFFFYIRQEQFEKIQTQQEPIIELSAEEKKQIEKDVREISGIADEETPVFLDFESIKVVKPGKYLVDLAHLFNRNKPRVYKLEDGKYVIDLSSRFVREHE